MYTSTSEHLIVHAFQPNKGIEPNLTIFRVVGCNRINDYIDEVNYAYYLDASHGDIDIYYNCGKYVDRLIKEIKQTESKVESIEYGVFKVYSTNKVDAMKCIAKDYLTYVTKSSSSTIWSNNDKENTKWDGILPLIQLLPEDVSGTIMPTFTLDESGRYEVDKEGWIVLTEAMILSMILTIFDIDREIFDKDMKSFVEMFAENEDTVQVKPLLRFCSINKNRLSILDIKRIMCKLDIDIKQFKYSEMVTSLIDKTKNEIQGYQYDHMLETYYRIDNEFNGFNSNCYSSIDDAYKDAVAKIPLKVKKIIDVSNNNTIVDQTKMYTCLDDAYNNHLSRDKMYLYHVPFLKRIIQRKEKFLYLNELSFLHTSPINPDVFNFVKDLNDNDISDLIDILTRLRATLSSARSIDDAYAYKTFPKCFIQDAQLSFEKPKQTRLNKIEEPYEREKVIETLHNDEKTDHDIIGIIDREVKQRYLTNEYARLFKDDNAQTMASVVINNISNYLSKHIKEEHINKNMISKDLITAGIKKMRKANGYVYGIEDTSNDRGLMDTVRTCDKMFSK